MEAETAAATATSSLAAVAADRDRLRSAEDDHVQAKESAENQARSSELSLAAQREINADLQRRLGAAQSSTPAEVASLRARLDVMTQARDAAVADADSAKTSLADAEARLSTSEAVPSAAVASLRGRIAALTASLEASESAREEAMTSQVVAETARLTADMALGSLRSEFASILGRASRSLSQSVMGVLSSAVEEVNKAVDDRRVGGPDRSGAGSKRRRPNNGSSSP